MKNYLLVLLAAGESKRFGAIKQLINYNGEPLVRSRIKELGQTANTETAVVLGANYHTVRMALAKYKAPVIQNKNWWKGMGSSISASAIYYQILQTQKLLDGLIITLVDQVDVQPEHIEKLIKKYESTHGQKIVASTYNNTLGAPAIFPNHCIEDLAELPFAQGAKKFIIDREYSLLALPEAGRDIDTPDDLKAYKRLNEQNPSFMGLI